MEGAVGVVRHVREAEKVLRIVRADCGVGPGVRGDTV